MNGGCTLRPAQFYSGQDNQDEVTSLLSPSSPLLCSIQASLLLSVAPLASFLSLLPRVGWVSLGQNSQLHQRSATLGGVLQNWGPAGLFSQHKNTECLFELVESLQADCVSQVSELRATGSGTAEVGDIEGRGNRGTPAVTSSLKMRG